MVMGSPLGRGSFEVVEGIVHETEIPLVIEAQSAVFHRRCNLGIGSRILCYEHGCGVALAEAGVHLFQEVKRVGIDTSALIAHPVDSPAYGVHSQAVEMVFLQPVIRRRLHEAANLLAGEVKIAGAPLTDGDVAGVIFVELGTVVPKQSVIVQRKMHRHKIKYHADAVLVASVDKLHELSGGAVS